MLKKNKTVFIFLFVLTRHHQKYEIQVLCHDSAPILAYISIHNLVSAWFLCGQTQITVLSVCLLWVSFGITAMTTLPPILTLAS